MQDIKPDTSLYTSPADRLIALGLVLKAEECGKQVECRLFGKGEWAVNTQAGRELSGMASNLFYAVNYRARPKPRELWALEINGNLAVGLYGSLLTSLARPSNLPSSHTPVRFVEQPE